MRARLNDALQYLNGLIRDGAEYPDAHAKAVIKYEVDGDLLRNAYDSQD